MTVTAMKNTSNLHIALLAVVLILILGGIGWSTFDFAGSIVGGIAGGLIVYLLARGRSDSSGSETSTDVPATPRPATPSEVGEGLLALNERIRLAGLKPDEVKVCEEVIDAVIRVTEGLWSTYPEDPPVEDVNRLAEKHFPEHVAAHLALGMESRPANAEQFADGLSRMLEHLSRLEKMLEDSKLNTAQAKALFLKFKFGSIS